MLELELEDIVKRRDYKLKYNWGCTQCYPNKMWNFVWIFLNRTTDDIERGNSNIKQICLQGHVTRPLKTCNKCGRTYQVEDDICKPCEYEVRKRAELEVGIELAEKEINRFKSQLKKKKITREEFDNLFDETRDKIIHIKTELINIG